MIGLDTNVLLRWLLDDSIVEDDHPAQTAAVSALILDSTETFFVNQIVLAETVWVVRNGLKQRRETVIEIVERLLLSGNVVVEREASVRAALVRYRRHGGDLPDHLIAEANAESGCRQTATFDQKATRNPHFFQLSNQ